MADSSNNTSAQTKPISRETRQAILRTVLEISRKNVGMDEETLLARLESETEPLFNQILSPGKTGEKSKPKARSIKRKRYERTDHVGRFFLHLMSDQLREKGIQSCMIPVFAKSVQGMIGDEPYEKFSKKIDRLLTFADERGYDYDQALASKPPCYILCRT